MNARLLYGPLFFARLESLFIDFAMADLRENANQHLCPVIFDPCGPRPEPGPTPCPAAFFLPFAASSGIR